MQGELNVIDTGLEASVFVELTILTVRLVLAPGESVASLPILTPISPRAKLLSKPKPIETGEVVSTAPELTLPPEPPVEERGGSSGELEPPPQADKSSAINAALTTFVVFRLCMASSWGYRPLMNSPGGRD